jgi:hypothetical protein
MRKAPKFKSEAEELEFWSTHSSVEFMDEGEEVQFDTSEARREGEARRTQARPRVQIIPQQLQRSVVTVTLNAGLGVAGAVRIETEEGKAPWCSTSHSSATTPSPATR